MDRFLLAPYTFALGLLGLTLAGCGGNSAPATSAPAAPPVTATAKDEPAPEPEVKAAPKDVAPPKPAPGAWTMATAEMRFPDAPAAGTVGGQPFALDAADLSNTGGLSLRQGKEFPAETEIKVFLFLNKNQAPAGKTFEVTPEGKESVAHVFATWKESGKQEALTFGDKYALKLEFGQERDGKLPGKIYLCLPDPKKSVVAGTFVADVEPDYAKPPRPSEAPYVAGKVALKGRPKYDLAAGIAGVAADGKPVTNLAGTEVTPKVDTSVTSTTFAPQLTTLANDAEAGCVYRHVRLTPGHYLVYVRLGARYLDWQWVDVTDKSQATVDFALDPDAAGNLQVILPPKSEKEKIRLIPLPADGKTPDLKDALDWVGDAVKTDVPAKDGKVLLDGLKPGKYRVVVGAAQRDVAVKAKETATADLTK